MNNFDFISFCWVDYLVLIDVVISAAGVVFIKPIDLIYSKIKQSR